MIWLIIFSPLIILFPLAIYLDRKKGAGDPKLDTDNYRLERDLARNENLYISTGGDGHGSG